MLIETSNEKDRFDEKLQISMYGQIECCIETMKWILDMLYKIIHNTLEPFITYS